MRRQLESLITSLRIDDKVKLVGAVPHERMHLWYNAADIFCLMSEREGLPNVLIESLACGVPAVATPVGGIPEIISSDQLGLLTGREESKIADAIRAALAKTWRAGEVLEHMHEIFLGSLGAHGPADFSTGARGGQRASGWRASP